MRRRRRKRRGLSFGVVRFGILGFWILVFWGEQVQQLGPNHFFEHARRQRVGRVVVANVNVQPVHHIEMGVGEQLLHGRVAHLTGHAFAHEGLEIGGRRQLLHIGHRGHGCGVIHRRCPWHSGCGGRRRSRCRRLSSSTWRTHLGARLGVHLRAGLSARTGPMSAVGHLGCSRFGLRWLASVQPLLAARPATEKIVAHAPGLAPLRLLSVLTETGCPKRSVRR